LLVTVGIVGGCAIILTLLVVLYCCCCKRQHSKKSRSLSSSSKKQNSAQPKERAPDFSAHRDQSQRRPPQRSRSADDAFAPPGTHGATRSIQRARSFDETRARSASQTQVLPRRGACRAASGTVAPIGQTPRPSRDFEPIYRSRSMSWDHGAKATSSSPSVSSSAKERSFAPPDRRMERAHSFDGSLETLSNGYGSHRRGGTRMSHGPHRDSAPQRSKSFDGRYPSINELPRRAGDPPVTLPTRVHHQEHLSLPSYSSATTCVLGGRSVRSSVGGIPSQQLVPTPPTSRRLYVVRRAASFAEAGERSSLPLTPLSHSPRNRSERSRSKSMDDAETLSR
jgi:hypothetical protein